MSIILLIGCTWAVFSEEVNDGFIGRHLLVFSVIASAGHLWSGSAKSLALAFSLVIAFFLWHMLCWFVKVWREAE